MYTGIIQGVFPIVGLKKQEGLFTLEIEFDSLLEKLKIGASISIDGVCLTVTSINENIISFDAMQETLEKTTISELNIGDYVNIERSAKQGAEVGGHIISGHVEGKAKVNSILKSPNNYIIEFKCSSEWMKYIVSKGFIGINGASLTIVDAKKNGLFQVHYIPETLKKTTFRLKEIGDNVNIEIDNQTKLIVDTVERYLNERKDFK